jgi:hypothetical protein
MPAQVPLSPTATALAGVGSLRTVNPGPTDLDVPTVGQGVERKQVRQPWESCGRPSYGTHAVADPRAGRTHAVADGSGEMARRLLRRNWRPSAVDNEDAW